ncbi:hypothetical protein HDU97_010277 [Phlyctochytrium planicorne]|nr:hypothetical protein HDU97_010277 [Phlyctochytrium planicorne]
MLFITDLHASKHDPRPFKEVYNALNVNKLGQGSDALQSGSSSIRVGQIEPVVVKDGEVTDSEGSGKVDLFWTGEPTFWFRCVKVLGIVVEIERAVVDDGNVVFKSIVLDDGTGTIQVSIPANFNDMNAFQDKGVLPGMNVDVLGRLVNGPKARWIDAYACIPKPDPHEEPHRHSRMYTLYRDHYFKSHFDRILQLKSNNPSRINAPFRSPLLRNPAAPSLQGTASVGQNPFMVSPMDRRRTGVGGAIPTARLGHPSSYGIVPPPDPVPGLVSKFPRPTSGGSGNANGANLSSSSSERDFETPLRKPGGCATAFKAFKPKETQDGGSLQGQVAGLVLKSSQKNAEWDSFAFPDSPFVLSPPERSFNVDDNLVADVKEGTRAKGPSLLLPPKKPEFVDGLTTEAILMALDEPFELDDDVVLSGGEKGQPAPASRAAPAALAQPAPEEQQQQQALSESMAALLEGLPDILDEPFELSQMDVDAAAAPYAKAAGSSETTGMNPGEDGDVVPAPTPMVAEQISQSKSFKSDMEDEFDDGFDMLMLDSLNEVENSIKEVQTFICDKGTGVELAIIKERFKGANVDVLLQRVADLKINEKLCETGLVYTNKGLYFPL